MARKFVLAASLLAVFIGTAVAQETAPPAPTPAPFVPFTITETDYKAMLSWLDERPMKFSFPVAKWLLQLEQKAAKVPDNPEPQK